MSNLSYCRFENTLRDLQDCYEFLQNSNGEDFDRMSAREYNSMVALVDLCGVINYEIKPFPGCVPEENEDE
jgi:hypothetical protein